LIIRPGPDSVNLTPAGLLTLAGYNVYQVKVINRSSVGDDLRIAYDYGPTARYPPEASVAVIADVVVARCTVGID
jgi:hypothetical protein